MGLGEVRHSMKERVWERHQKQDQRVRVKNGGEMMVLCLQVEIGPLETVNTGLKEKDYFF